MSTISGRRAGSACSSCRLTDEIRVDHVSGDAELRLRRVEALLERSSLRVDRDATRLVGVVGVPIEVRVGRRLSDIACHAQESVAVRRVGAESVVAPYPGSARHGKWRCQSQRSRRGRCRPCTSAHAEARHGADRRRRDVDREPLGVRLEHVASRDPPLDWRRRLRCRQSRPTVLRSA